MIPAGFFPAEIHHFFTSEKYGRDVLSENEKSIAAKFGSKRLADFSTGRYCLRQCTSRFGFAGDILIGEKGMPMLPDDITASVSHSKNVCGAIAGNRNKFLSVGLDIETCNRVHKDMWRLLFTAHEISLIQEIDISQQNLITTIFFSLKEAFYKLQYPLTGVFLDFHDVEINIADNRYYIKTLRPVSSLFKKDQLIEGNTIAIKDEIVTYCLLPAEYELK